jgi:hypothetical protein
MVVTGRVVDGRVIPDKPLPEGASVTVVVDDEEPLELTGEEAEELEAAIAEADADPNQWEDFGEFLKKLREGS